MRSEATKTLAAAAAGTAILLGGLAAGYRWLGRTKCLTWGASGEEIARIMPGDVLLPDPDIVATRSVTISAGPGAVWPWLVQMGPGRGGATIGMGSTGPRLRVAILEPERAMALASEDGQWVWSFGLYPTTGGTRLVSRNRIAMSRTAWPMRLFNHVVMEPGSLLMERKMLLGIKQRAERGACVPSSGTVGEPARATQDRAGGTLRDATSSVRSSPNRIR
ncbi:SRPBCC family protein [Nocardia sp. NEAU-G5]|uniref:SRPBCC family protein n=1 Tax=Nocardia albiluteola TaxID=2842303 RepID=A0ABS6AWH9_9NOCA|nr:SRPBCC family protein [Nocardia albiluteola]MBU3062406.1 SRPBCC family protein [Nocardia albiluteola]